MGLPSTLVYLTKRYNNHLIKFLLDMKEVKTIFMDFKYLYKKLKDLH